MNQSARYAIEHEVIPSVLFSPDGAALVQRIVTEKGSFLSSFYNKFCTDGEDGYNEGQFEIFPFFLSDELASVRVELPGPERAPLCHTLYILHSKDFRFFRYFTVERNGDGNRQLGEWTPDKKHLDYGEVDAEHAEQLAAIAGILLPDTPKS